ncbi:MAG: DNA mismatch repair protein MutS [Lentisphaeria bacterium]|nr:DNA mismatch repair protein MutS [Lentisphaeria bacterium]
MKAPDEKLTPMMRQYREAKAAIPPDAVLLFRLGDFYEEFFEDAEKVSSTLDLVMTKRQGIPMCGFPYHALESYLPKLVGAGLKVAIADQMEDPKLAKGIVKREITRIITPGTVTEGTLLNSGINTYAAALYRDKTGSFALALLDVSVGEFFVFTGSREQIDAELRRFDVRETLVDRELLKELKEEGPLPGPEKMLFTELDPFEFDFQENDRFLCAHFGVISLDGFGCREFPQAVCAAGALLRYASNNLCHEAGHVVKLELRSCGSALELDPISLRNLEIVCSMYDKSKAGSLLGVLDKTVTPMGGRKLRNWLLRPLKEHDPIVERQDAVEGFLYDQLSLAELRETIGVVRDVERITGKLNIGSAGPRDMLALAASLECLPGVRLLLEPFDLPVFERELKRIADFGPLVERIFKTIDENTPALLAEGGVIKSGFSPELDELRSAAKEGKSWLAQIQMREIERTGIKSLKVKFNSVFGYYIEVSKANLAAVPDDYVRKQTLVNAERFITPELKELENKILGAEEKARNLEYALFTQLREEAVKYTAALQEAADAVAVVDALSGLAETARLYHYTRPAIFEDDRLTIIGGRHPVIDRMIPGNFVPNDCKLDGDLNRLMLITGPNMAGKSTYIRQTALLVIMAQLGSFIPAESAEIGLVDRIFTRVGAADDLARGQSTFMVEMLETANILNHATAKSLVILDEIGRGTSTFDGLSIAWSVAEFLHDEIRCRTQFATHYHELTEMARTRRGVNNYNVAVREYGEEIIFLRQIMPGPSDRSYGIHVAKLAGLPGPVLERAKDLLELLERTGDAQRQAVTRLPRRTVRLRKKPHDDDSEQLLLF